MASPIEGVSFRKISGDKPVFANSHIDPKDTDEVSHDSDKNNEVHEIQNKEKETETKQNDNETETKQNDKDTKQNDEKSKQLKPEPDSAKKRPEGLKLLDLAFAMDCTGSMGSYIRTAQQSIRNIVEEVVSKEKADVQMALVEYRDHPPQDNTFVTRVHDFTQSVSSMKQWLDGCSAKGGGDCPEAVADALHQILKLSWRDLATKICVLISDAPPHGLAIDSGDGFPNGCPDGLDPMVTTGQIAEKGITIYSVGCEPAILRYKDFFMSIAHMTGGQYVPLSHANLLPAVIIGGAQEELSLQELQADLNRQIEERLAFAEEGSVNYGLLCKEMASEFKTRGVKTKQMHSARGVLPKASETAQKMAYCTNLAEARKELREAKPTDDCYELEPHRFSARSTKRSSFLGGMKERFFGSHRRDVPVESVLEPPTRSNKESSNAAAEDCYMVREDMDIAEEQVYRMVSKSLGMSKLRTKTKSTPAKAPPVKDETKVGKADERKDEEK